MKVLLQFLAFVLVLLILLAAFGGSLSQAEPFYSAAPDALVQKDNGDDDAEKPPVYVQDLVQSHQTMPSTAETFVDDEQHSESVPVVDREDSFSGNNGVPIPFDVISSSPAPF